VLPPSLSCATTANNKLLRRLVFITGTTLGLAPWRHWWTTTRGLAFSTTEWVVNWVHCNTASLWAYALPTVTTGFTDLDKFVFCVTNFTYGCAAIQKDATHFG
jgi:hypothetical protein